MSPLKGVLGAFARLKGGWGFRAKGQMTMGAERGHAVYPLYNLLLSSKKKTKKKQ